MKKEIIKFKLKHRGQEGFATLDDNFFTFSDDIKIPFQQFSLKIKWKEMNEMFMVEFEDQENQNASLEFHYIPFNKNTIKEERDLFLTKLNEIYKRNKESNIRQQIKKEIPKTENIIIEHEDLPIDFETFEKNGIKMRKYNVKINKIHSLNITGIEKKKNYNIYKILTKFTTDKYKGELEVYHRYNDFNEFKE